MDIAPSKTGQRFINNWAHFYTIIGLVPVLVITTITSIRANPELSEVPEGYEPRHWEYHKHPITRFIARYCTTPDETERECNMALYQDIAENEIIKVIVQRCEKVMTFYNDHRTLYFLPYFGEYFRSGRDEAEFQTMHVGTELGEYIDKAYDPESVVLPTEGYTDGPPLR